jgi:hypothetical protein
MLIYYQKKQWITFTATSVANGQLSALITSGGQITFKK